MIVLLLSSFPRTESPSRSREREIISRDNRRPRSDRKSSLELGLERGRGGAASFGIIAIPTARA
jgi:hypothetical protein